MIPNGNSPLICSVFLYLLTFISLNRYIVIWSRISATERENKLWGYHPRCQKVKLNPAREGGLIITPQDAKITRRRAATLRVISISHKPRLEPGY